ncbi:uncharacterized protein UBRO_20160 [Ustilago bromivora]|uniref:Retroviral polymerase SH3-like domain-containing protein n=1 Tax=Ustilago bromivora TaxID=307758 RepID=A0A1K0FVX7_9BASI|nr:uncharacterized protein UBRO_20160 [Ustilago bromivora]
MNNAFAECAIQMVQKITSCMLFDTNIGKRWWPFAISQVAYIHNQLTRTTRDGKTPFETFYGKVPELRHVCRFSCTAYVILRGNTRTTWLRENPVISKHLHPRALRSTYLGYLDTTCAIKGHRVWLPELDCIVIVKDVRFSEHEHLSVNPPPFHVPVLSDENELLKSYSWLPSGDPLANSDDENITTSSLQHFSWQQGAQPPDNIASDPDPYPEWDHMMSDICDAGEIIINMDAIHAVLNVRLDDATAEGGTDTNPEVSTDTSQLGSPQFDLYNEYTLSTPKSPSSESPDPLGMLSFMTFATSCAIKPATKTLGHYLDQIAFATIVMNRVALTASSQQLCSADSILLEPSSLSDAQKRDDWVKWKEAMNIEMDSMQKMDVFELIDLPTDGKLIGV